MENTGTSRSFGLKGHPFSQPGLKALDIVGVCDFRAEGPAIRWGLSLGDSSNGQPVGGLVTKLRLVTPILEALLRRAKQDFRPA